MPIVPCRYKNIYSITSKLIGKNNKLKNIYNILKTTQYYATDHDQQTHFISAHNYDLINVEGTQFPLILLCHFQGALTVTYTGIVHINHYNTSAVINNPKESSRKNSFELILPKENAYLTYIYLYIDRPREVNSSCDLCIPKVITAKMLNFCDLFRLPWHHINQKHTGNLIRSTKKVNNIIKQLHG